MSDISRYTASDVTKATRSDVSRVTRSDVTKPARSDVSRATRSDVTKTSQKPSLPTVANRLLGPERALNQQARLTVSRWRGHGIRSGQPSLGLLASFGGGGDRLAKTVNALRAAVRFRGPENLDAAPADQHQTDPEPSRRFQADKVKKLLDAILENRLESFRYDSATAGKMVKDLSQQITDEVKAFEFPRYKLVCNVLLGEVGGQDLQISTRCLWNTYSDSYACATYKTATYFVVALVHATYFE